MIEALYNYGKVVLGETSGFQEEPSADVLLILDFDSKGKRKILFLK